jgi:protein-L-isoaspartate O-methyltransferase
MMLLATTNQLTENVAPVPLLWIVPLAIYLITFILAFENPRWYRRNLMLRLLAIALISIAYLISDINLSDAILVSLPIFCAGLFIACMFCHGELNGLKPPADQLTSFYLSIALGGALGAIFVGLIAPVVFAGVYELPVAMLAVAALAVWLMWPYGWSQRLLWSAVAITMIVVAGAQVRAYHRNAVELVRGFYGSLRVVQLDDARVLYHGTVEHGAQFTDERQRKSPTTYYGYSSGAGLALESLKSPKRVGVIGLGAGTLAAYSQAGDDVHFYEINPQMVDIANRQFLFLRDSGARIEITLGDARLSLESEPPQNFDALLVDAFSGDAIPVHLLTKEAFAIYLRHLKSDGILAIHVSNQFLDLAPIVAQLAALNHLPAREFISGKDESRRLLAATWIVMTRNPGFWSRPEIARASRPISVRPDLRPWTDDYNNLLQVMQWIPVQ